MDIVGTVSATISFVDFIVKVVQVGKEIADTGDALEEHQKLDNLASTVNQGYSDLQQKLDQKGDGALSQEETSLLTVLRHYREIHGKIIVLREKNKVDKPQKDRTKSLADRGKDQIGYGIKVGWVAIRVMWSSKEEGDGLRDQFTACVAVLNSTLVLIMRKENLDKWDTATETLGKFFETQNENKDHLAQIINKCNTISSIISRWSRDLERHGDQLSSFEIKFDQQSKRQNNWQGQLQELRRLFTLMDKASQELGYLRVLHDISFGDMDTRRNNIQETHPTGQSFEWLVDNTRVPNEPSQRSLGISFQNWLKDGGGVFYISGKPGSGKSTVMNFLSDHTMTKGHLNCWQPDRKTLVVAPVFFWSIGSTHQKSKDGLFRTLLYSILAASMERLIPLLFSEELKQQQSHLFSSPVQGPPGKLASPIIEQKLEHLISHPPEDLKLCVFIDGADEFQDPNTENYKLAQLLKRWSANPWMKICLAGREEEPWLGDFGKGPRLRLHQATSRDIRLMIENSISGHTHFRSFEPVEREAFIKKFVEKSEGVFLWVRYVKSEIVEALDYRRNPAKLYEILNNWPTDLRPFYERMFCRINHKEAWVILRIMTTAIDKWKDPNCLLAHHYSFVEDVLRSDAGNDDGNGLELDVPDEARQNKEIFRRLGGPGGFISQVPLLFRGVLETTARKDHRIYNTSGPGLVLVHEFLRTNLTFTHITARYYLVEYLNGGMGSDTPEQRRITNAEINEPRLVLQLLTRQVLAHWDTISPRRLLDILETIIPWIKTCQGRNGFFEELIHLERALMRRQPPGFKLEPDIPGYYRHFLCNANCDILAGRHTTDIVDLTSAPQGMVGEGESGIVAIKNPHLEPLLSVLAHCAVSGFVQFLDWLREAPRHCSEAFASASQQVALIFLLLQEVNIRTPAFSETLTLLLKEPEPIQEGREPGRRILDPFLTVPDTRGIIGHSNLTVFEVFILTVIQDPGFFSGDVSIWKAVATFVQHGAKTDIRFRAHIFSVSGSGPDRRRASKLVRLDDPRDSSRTRKTYYSPDEVDFQKRQRASQWGLGTAMRERKKRGEIGPHAIIIETAGQTSKRTIAWKVGTEVNVVEAIGARFPHGASLNDIFDLFGPKTKPDISRVLNPPGLPVTANPQQDTPDSSTGPESSPWDSDVDSEVDSETLDPHKRSVDKQGATISSPVEKRAADTWLGSLQGRVGKIVSMHVSIGKNKSFLSRVHSE